MREGFWQKVRRIALRPMMRFITGHQYDCCGTWIKRCSRCKYVIEDQKWADTYMLMNLKER